MFWRNDQGKSLERRAARWIERYLNPAANWTPRHQEQLRSAMEECPPVRLMFNRALVFHRMMLGLPADQPSAHENRRLESLILSPLSTRGRGRSEWWGWVGAAAALGGLAVFVQASGGQSGVQPGSTPEIAGQGADSSIRARGAGDSSLNGAGLGITGVTEGGSAYEVMHAPVHKEDYLRFETRCESDLLSWVSIVGVQPGRAPVLYFPAEPTGLSTPLACAQGGKRVALDDEILLEKDHEVGVLHVVAIFSERPLAGASLASLIPPVSGVPDVLAIRQRVDQIAPQLGAVDVQVISTRVIEGTKGTALPAAPEGQR